MKVNLLVKHLLAIYRYLPNIPCSIFLLNFTDQNQITGSKTFTFSTYRILFKIRCRSLASCLVYRYLLVMSYFARIRNFPPRIQGQKDSRSASKNLSIFKPKILFLSSRKYNPRILGSGSWCLPNPVPGVKKAPDPQHWFSLNKKLRYRVFDGFLSLWTSHNNRVPTPPILPLGDARRQVEIIWTSKMTPPTPLG
jgi:hypothetical protein